ncbi:MAG: lysylphosphatidylglycerol synthase transmembrane domain-containing protein [Candidatus Micrarchaeota archaeon]
MKRNLFFAANVALALVLLSVILSTIDFGSLEKTLAQTDFALLLLAAFFYLATHFISALRYKLLLPSHSLSSLFSSHMKAMLASDATPGRVGYSFFIFDLRNKDLRGGRGAKVMGVSFASDFLVRGLLALAAVWIFSRDFGSIGAIVVIASLAAFAMLFYRIRILAKAISRLPFYGKKLENAYHTVFEQKTSSNQLAWSILFSILGAIARGLEWVFVLQAVGLNAGLVEMTILSALLTALSFVPLSLSGFGLQEGGGMVLLSSLFGFSLLQAAGVMLLVRAIDLACDLAVGGWFFATGSKQKKKVK